MDLQSVYHEYTRTPAGCTRMRGCTSGLSRMGGNHRANPPLETLSTSHARPIVGVSKSQGLGMFSKFGDKFLQNGSKKAQTAPSTHTGDRNFTPEPPQGARGCGVTRVDCPGRGVTTSLSLSLYLSLPLPLSLSLSPCRG
jgi:hypothetical protein